MNKGITVPEGIGIHLPAGMDAQHLEAAFARHPLRQASLHWCKTAWVTTGQGPLFTVRLRKSIQSRLCPGWDTLDLRRRLAHRTEHRGDDALAREAWVALLCAPQRIHFDSLEALETHIRVRCNIARAAEKTALAFRTDAAERPEAFWVEKEDVGFLLRPGAGLIDALVAATQPEVTGRLYDFSCYRATEYVILLGIAQEARQTDPALYARMEACAQARCIKSGLFHEVFLVEYGTIDAPVPKHFYIPGDRVWFKNPHEGSSDASGYEGSWVIYLGGGRFSNFWQRDRHYTLAAKSLEVYHWRDGAYLDPEATLQMDEDIVESRVAATRRNPIKRRRVLQQMYRYRDPTGIYGQGGCLDASREFPRQLGHIKLS